MPADLSMLLGATLLIVGAVLPVVNPLGDAPIFLTLTPGCDAATRAELARRIAFYSFGLLLGSMLLGSFVLRLFDLSIPVVQVAGGAVVCALGWKLLSDDDPKAVQVVVDPHGASLAALSKVFYPLTMPLTVDPGAMSVAVTVGANHAHTVARVAIEATAAVLGSAIVALSIWLTYRYAERIGRWIGHRGMLVVLRLSAFIVLCIGVQITWNGVKTLLTHGGFGG
jgi:multiple antibiotic resistance protein